MEYPTVVREMTPGKRAEYDVFIAAVGYERRARYVVQELQPEASRKLGIGFEDRQVFEYSNNREILTRRGYRVEVVADGDLLEWLEREMMKGPLRERDRIRVGVDISSFSRFRIAAIVHALRRVPRLLHKLCVAEFYYSVALFSKPPKSAGPNIVVGPVAHYFAGWTTRPDLPLAAVLGLGYEEDKALGAFEHVQASARWLVRPISIDHRFDTAVTNANRRLLEGTPAGRVLGYCVSDPLGCFGIVESLVFGLTRDYNIIVLPFGPKPFALCSLLVACIHPSVAVWRVSAGGFEDPKDQKASGNVYGLQVEFNYPEEGNRGGPSGCNGGDDSTD